MKQYDPSEQRKSKQWGRTLGKGFFIALTVCLIGVGGMAVSTFHVVKESSEETTVTTTSATTAVVQTTTSAAPAAAKPVSTTRTSVPSQTTSTTNPSGALFVLPMGKRVVAPFSDTPVWSETMEDYRAHPGMDFGGDPGKVVLSLANGTVSEVANEPTWGGSVTVEHGDGVVSVYRGVSPMTEVGAQVLAGDPIGELETSPCEKAMEPHLHLELYRDGVAVDPSTLLGSLLENSEE